MNFGWRVTRDDFSRKKKIKDDFQISVVFTRMSGDAILRIRNAGRDQTLRERLGA